MIKTTSSFLMCFRNSKGLASYTIKTPSYINFYFSDLKLLLTESKTNTGSYPWQISLTFFSSFFFTSQSLKLHFKTTAYFSSYTREKILCHFHDYTRKSIIIFSNHFPSFIPKSISIVKYSVI